MGLTPALQGLTLASQRQVWTFHCLALASKSLVGASLGPTGAFLGLAWTSLGLAQAFRGLTLDSQGLDWAS